MSSIVRGFRKRLKKLVSTPVFAHRQTQTFKSIIARDRSKQSFYKIRRY